ncbi:hypothetical protein OG758_00440 [Streptomyces sp. NBC_01474]|uniref:hypothetical protein n=1 Tax=Streptomyces sp. NBC_01474 TaxID=2903880 RepID=UPI002DD98C15|nr:hypothetical protein [Streptomyces sp. NBC_01474]WSD92832.1 hypothetical protein OG758_00440 [Streptomyces sp. NBC_01474]
MQRLADQLVREAVVVECERGASWADIAKMAGVSRQAAHERWSPVVVEGWALMGRKRTGIGTGTASAELAENLNEWFAELDTEHRTDAITATLPSYADPAARTHAQGKREQAAELRSQEDDLRRAADDASHASMAAIGTEDAEQKRAAWATALLARASAYDRLAAVEAPLGREHKRSAGTQRALAQDVLRGATTKATGIAQKATAE